MLSLARLVSGTQAQVAQHAPRLPTGKLQNMCIVAQRVVVCVTSPARGCVPTAPVMP